MGNRAMDFCTMFLLGWLIIAIIAIVAIVSAPKVGFQPPMFAKEMVETSMVIIVLGVPIYVMETLVWTYNVRDGTEWGVCIGIGIVLFVVMGLLWSKALKKYFPEKPKPQPQYGYYAVPQYQYPTAAYPYPSYQASPYPVQSYSRCIYCGNDFPPGAQYCNRCGAKR